MLVSTEPGGLGNRIKSWVSAMRLDPAAKVHWPQTENMPAAFGDLFVNDCSVERLPDAATEHCSWQLAVLPEDSAELPPGFAAVVSDSSTLGRRVGRAWSRLRGRADDRYRYLVAPKRFSRHAAGRNGRVIDFEYGRIPEHFLGIYRPLFERVAVRPDILERVEGFAAEHLGVATVGVQVRTWRDSPRRHRKHFRPAVKRLERLLGGIAGDRRVVVVSDDDDVVPWLERLLGPERVLAYPRVTRRRQSWQSTEGMIEDLIDMLLLARTDELFASYLSTFSETAWWLGGARARVAVF